MRHSLFLLSALLFGGAYSLTADILYSVTDLGTLGGNSSGVGGINNSGQIAGGSYTSSGADHAFLYTNGQMKDLGTLGGSNSYAVALNSSGQVTGDSSTPSGATQAFLYSNGQMTNLGGSSFDSYGRSINDLGQVAGIVSLPSGGAYAFLYTNGQMKNLGTLGGNSSYAYGINNSGQVVGGAQIVPGSATEHSFLYSNGKMTDLDPLGGYSFATAINNSGQITGYNDKDHAFLYSNGQMTDLGTAPGYRYSSGEGINSAGQIVGQLTGGSVYGLNHAFVDSNGQMADLNNLIDPSLGITLAFASSINDSGQIVAGGSTANGNSRAYLLTPLTPVPEPGTWALLGVAGLVLLGGARWRRELFRAERKQPTTDGTPL